MSCPTSWSRDHDDSGYKCFNLQPKDLVGEEKETFNQLETWGARLKRGLKKFYCDKIIRKVTESPEALKALLDEWYAYDPEMDPTLDERDRAAEEKAKKKAGQKRKRQFAGRDEGSSGSQRERSAESLALKEPSEDSALLEHFGINIPKRRTLQL